MRVLQVRLDEPGGGVVYVRAAMVSAPPDLEMTEIAIDPEELRLSPVGWWRSAMEIRRAIRRCRAQVIHAHGVRAAAATVLGSLRLGRRRVVTIQGLHSIRRARTWSAPFVRVLNRYVLGAFDRVMVVSKSDQDSIVGQAIAPVERVRLVRTTFEPPVLQTRDAARDSIDIPRSDTVVLWVGRFSFEKDPLTFVRSMVDLSGVTGLMVGDGPLLAWARSLAVANDANILLTGWLEDPTPAFAAADVYVNTSKWEGMPVAVLEAAAAEIRLVLSDVPGNRDLVAAGVPAVTFPFGDAKALASRIQEVLADGLHVAPNSGRSIVLDTYNPKNLIDDLTAVYAEVATR